MGDTFKELEMSNQKKRKACDILDELDEITIESDDANDSDDGIDDEDNSDDEDETDVDGTLNDADDILDDFMNSIEDTECKNIMYMFMSNYVCQ